MKYIVRPKLPIGNNQTKQKRRALTAFLLLLGTSAHAQDFDSRDGGTATSAAGNPAKLEDVVVSGAVPATAATVPTRPTGSVFGLDQTVRDTPRSIYQVSKDQLINDPIRDATDLARYAPSVSNYAGQGQAGVPYIRGQQADVYEDGMRQGRSTRPFNTNGYENLDIVTGPGSVIYGATSKTSGYIDWDLKKPAFDGFHQEVDLTFGTISLDRNYADFTQRLDSTGPLIKDKLAYRFSIEERESDTYYDGAYNNYTNIFGALTWLPTDKLRFDLSVQYGNYNTSNIRGWNRITQDLLDNGNYLSGVPTPVLRYGTNYYEPRSNGTWVTVTPVRSSNGLTIQKYVNPQASAAPTGTGTLFGFVLGADPNRPVTTTDISRAEGLQNPNDQLDIQQWNLHQDTTLAINDNLSVVNKFYYEHDDVLQTTYIDASLQADRTDIFEDRAELRLKAKYDLGKLKIAHDSNTGIDIRYIDDTSVFGNSNYLINPFDLTQGGSNLTLGTLYGGASDAAILNNKGTLKTGPGFNGATVGITPYYSVNGIPNPVKTTGNNTFAVHSRVAQYGLYTLHSFKLGDQITLLLGARGTLVHAKDTNPVVGGYTATSFIEDDTVHFLPNLTGSITYKPVPWATTYFTYNYLQAFNEAPGSSGGIGYGGLAGRTPQLLNPNFHSESKLYEGGVKFEIIPNQLFASVAGYEQERTGSPILIPSGSVEFPLIEAHGIELAVNYQPNRHFNVGVNYSWLEAHYQNFAPFAGFGSPYGLVPDGQTVFSTTGAANAAFPRGDYRIALPAHRVDGFASYQFSFGLGFRADLWVTTGYNSINSQINVPAQYNINLGAFYERKIGRSLWRASVDVLNVTNNLNFALANVDTATENLIPYQPVSVQAKLSVKF